MTFDDIFECMGTIGNFFEFVFSEVFRSKFKKFFKCFWCLTTSTAVSFRVRGNRSIVRFFVFQEFIKDISVLGM